MRLRNICRDPASGKEQWYKFDDGEVTECKMNEDEEMKAQCFGGDYMGEVFDNNLKRMQFRRQKRWWNAYMLFYTRCDQQPPKQPKPNVEQLSLAESRNCVLPMPAPIERSVRTQNIRFMHSRSLFTIEFFNFIRKLVASCAPPMRLDKLVREVGVRIGEALRCNRITYIMLVMTFLPADTANGRTLTTGHPNCITVPVPLRFSNKENDSRCRNWLVWRIRNITVPLVGLLWFLVSFFSSGLSIEGKYITNLSFM